MQKNFKKLTMLAIVLAFVLGIFVGTKFLNKPEEPVVPDNPGITNTVTEIEEDGVYTSKEEVSLYMITYHKLPSNYISKTKAKKLGWVPEKGNLQDVCEGCSIGGGPFNNSEGILPDDDYYECDIDYEGGQRNAKRLVYNKWGNVYYTDDHYKSFIQLYGEDDD